MFKAKATRGVGALRRRMPRHLLSAISLLLVLLCRAWGPAFAAVDASEDSVTLFKACDRDIDKELCDEALAKDVRFLSSPFIVFGDGVMVALAEALYIDNSKKGVEIVVRYIEIEGPDWLSKAIEKNGDIWRTQLVLSRGEGVNYYSLNDPTAFIKDKKIYLLAITDWRNKSSQSGIGWHFALSVGAITGEVGSKKIEWGSSEPLHSKLTQEIENRHLNASLGPGHPAFLRSNGAIVFSAKAKNKEGKRGYAILQLNDEEEQWEVSFVEDPEECFFFSVYEWKERLVSVIFGCSTDTFYAKEYDEVNKEWKDVDDRLLHLWINKQKPSYLTHVTIGNKTALVFTGKLKSFNDGTSEMSLYFTDGKRVKTSVWSIKTPYTDVSSVGLFYTNGELFVMYQDTSKGSGAIVLTHLHDQMRYIESVLNDWAENDAYLSKPCSETAPESASLDTLCVTPMPTDGLVSFLSNRSNSNSWVDDNYLMGATVSGGTRVKNGYTFRGADSGAKWPLGERFLSKRYEFTKYGLTVMGTVTIHETPKDDTPLLTVKEFGSHGCYGLWYKNNQWKVVSKNDKEEPATDLEVQKQYRVALILQNNTISMYVNGKSLGSPLPISTPGGRPFVLWGANIGRYGCKTGSGLHMTATNALFYTRALSDTELKTTSKTIATAMSTDSEKTPEPVPGPTNKTQAVPEPTSTTKAVPEPTNKAESVPELTNKTQPVTEPTNKTEMPRDPEDRSVCVRMSFSSLFLLGCFFLVIF